MTQVPWVLVVLGVVWVLAVEQAAWGFWIEGLVQWVVDMGVVGSVVW